LPDYFPRFDIDSPRAEIVTVNPMGRPFAPNQLLISDPRSRGLP
jgi:hypothetical protein